MTERESANTSRWSAEVALRVQFYDLDPMQVVWHGNYARFFEAARCAVLDTIQYNYTEMKESGYAWPIIDMHTRFLQPATFSQELLVRATIVEWEYRLMLNYLIRDSRTGMRITKGSTTQVAVDLSTGLMCLQSPAILFDKLRVPFPC